MPQRRTVRRPAKPSHVTQTNRTFGAHVKAFLTSFTSPSRFKTYWLSRAGAIRILKLAGAGVLLVVAVFLYFIPSLPRPGQINAAIGQTTTFYARDGTTKLYELHGNQNRIIDSFDTIPADVKNATISIEDRNFYKEGAFSVVGIARAALTDVTHRGVVQGGSTITQQYVKNALLTDNQSISRKIKELILSIEIELTYSKDQILSFYLNEIPYGNGAYGIEAACRTYFSGAPNNYGNNNCAQHLNLGQSALLAAIPNLPSYYNPYGDHQQELIDRQHLILDQMVKQGYIDQKKADAAKWTVAMLDNSKGNTQLAINKEPAFYSAITAPNFVFTLQDQLEEKYGTSVVDNGGWKVVTTLDPNLQKYAEKSIYNVCDPSNPNADHSFDKYNKCNANGGSNYSGLLASKGTNAAMVAADPSNGQVLAMVGSYNFADSQVNVATALRQPGSSFKPYIYATLFGQGKNTGCSTAGTGSSNSCTPYGAGSILNDTTTNFGTSGSPYTPHDFDNKTRGPVTVRTALDGSLNIPAVQALKITGVQASLNTAYSMGISTISNADACGLSLVLGCGDITLYDHVNAYESFANGGMHYQPTMVLKITDRNGKTLVDNSKAPSGKRVLDQQVAYLINNILTDSDARTYEFGNLLNVPGQTGHGLNAQGLATKTGTTSNYIDAWTMGYSPTLVAGVWAGNNDNSPMNSEAADIAAPIWKSFMEAALAGQPLVSFPKPTGLQMLNLPNKGAFGTVGSDLFPSWYKQGKGDAQVIDKISGLLATNCTPPLAKQTVYGEDITGTDNVHSCDDAQPTVSLTGLGGTGPNYSGSAIVSAGKFPLSQLQIYFDDQIISTQAISGNGSYDFTYTATSGGSHVFKAVVTDSGDYQASDTQAVEVANAGGGGFFGQSPSGTVPATGVVTNVTFTWTSDSAASYTLFLASNGGAAAAVGSTANTTLTRPLAKGSYTWYVSDGQNQTQPLSFTVQ